MEVFGHFHKYWPGINHFAFSAAVHSEATASIVNPWKNDMINFAKIQLEKFQKRNDLCKILEHTIIFTSAFQEQFIGLIVWQEQSTCRRYGCS